MKTLIISGLSGAGKSKAASYLEDAGYFSKTAAKHIRAIVSSSIPMSRWMR